MKPYPLVCQLKPYIQPFERILAVKELATLAGAPPIACPGQGDEPTNYRVVSYQPQDYLTDRLTYWEYLAPEIAGDGVEASAGPPPKGSTPYALDATIGSITEISPRQLTRQVRREATTNLIKNGISPIELQTKLPFRGEVPLQQRRNLRYGPHGIHEYRGKFFPQLVRSLLNIADAKPSAQILDPMCGSGTTLVEAVLLGCQAYGLDLNPLSVLVSQVKCDILLVPPDQLVTEYEALKTDLLNVANVQEEELIWFRSLKIKDQEYLSNWFAPEVLAQLDPIMLRINRISNPACRNLFKVVLSNIIRKISWQKDDDLRVRREILADVNIDVMAEFTTELNRSVRTILAFLYENQDFAVGQAKVIEGDTRLVDQILNELTRKVDVIITSPPYATALPYLDTDRLSLYYLDLLSRSGHRQRDYGMIGNREITNSCRQLYWEKYQQNRHRLTDDITSVIDLIHDLNNNEDTGFRRRNLPSLLARYFLDMRCVFEAITKLLRPGAPAFVVVGNNHTIAGGRRVEIETDRLLAQLGEAVGLRLVEKIPMEMLVSRDIFKKNASNAETILFFKNN